MKTKAQKISEVDKGKELLAKSKFVILTDFSKVRAEDVRKLRSELRSLGSGFLVIKKRLLGIVLKDKGIEFDSKKYKVSVGSAFAPDIESAAGTIYRFFKNVMPDIVKEKILGGYDIAHKRYIDADEMLMIGQLPPREALLGQLLGMIAAPIRSLLYVLKEKSNKTVESKA